MVSDIVHFGLKSGYLIFLFIIIIIIFHNRLVAKIMLKIYMKNLRRKKERPYLN